VFTWPTAITTCTSMSSDDFQVLIDWKDTEGDVTLDTSDCLTLTVSNIGKEVEKNWATVELVYTEELDLGEYTTNVKTVNADLSTPKAYKRLALPFKFAVISQNNDSDANQTEFKFDLQIDDDANVNYISSLRFLNGTTPIATWAQDIEDGTTETYYADDLAAATKADVIEVTMDWTVYTINKAAATYAYDDTVTPKTLVAGWYADLFKVTNSSKEVQVYAKKN
jgi:hypothetical protein